MEIKWIYLKHPKPAQAYREMWRNYSIILDQMLIIIHRMLINDEVRVKTMQDNDLNITNIPFKIT